MYNGLNHKQHFKKVLVLEKKRSELFQYKVILQINV